MDRSVSPLSARSQSVELFSLNMWQQNICAFGLWFCLHMRKIQESSLLGIVIEWWKQFLEYWCLCHSCFISLLKMMCRLYFLSELWCTCSWASLGSFQGGEKISSKGRRISRGAGQARKIFKIFSFYYIYDPFYPQFLAQTLACQVWQSASQGGSEFYPIPRAFIEFYPNLNAFSNFWIPSHLIPTLEIVCKLGLNT